MLSVGGLLVLVVAVTMVGCGSESTVSADRESLLELAQEYLPAWDKANLTYPLSAAMADCSDHELADIVELFICHREESENFNAQDCPDGNSQLFSEGCYAEVSDECRALASPSEACIQTYNEYLEASQTEAASFSGAIATEQTSGTPSMGDCAGYQDTAQLCRAAYNPDNIPDFLPQGFNLVQSYEGATVGVGFIATQGTGANTKCYVAYRGTKTMKEWYKDFQSVTLTKCVNDNGEQIGQGRSCGYGFYTVYEQLRTAGLNKKIREMVTANMCKGGLVITGHSLGAALSSILVADLISTDPTTYNAQYLEQFTYGEPRGLATALANDLNAKVTKYRNVNHGDPVPSVPYLGFKHFGTAWENYKVWTNHSWFGLKGQNFAPIKLENAAFANINAHLIPNYIDRLQNCGTGSK